MAIVSGYARPNRQAAKCDRVDGMEAPIDNPGDRHRGELQAVFRQAQATLAAEVDSLAVQAGDQTAVGLGDRCHTGIHEVFGACAGEVDMRRRLESGDRRQRGRVDNLSLGWTRRRLVVADPPGDVARRRCHTTGREQPEPEPPLLPRVTHAHLPVRPAPALYRSTPARESGSR